jgi:hypothetical protein
MQAPTGATQHNAKHNVRQTVDPGPAAAPRRPPGPGRQGWRVDSPPSSFARSPCLRTTRWGSGGRGGSSAGCCCRPTPRMRHLPASETTTLFPPGLRRAAPERPMRPTLLGGAIGTTWKIPSSGAHRSAWARGLASSRRSLSFCRLLLRRRSSGNGSCWKRQRTQHRGRTGCGTLVAGTTATTAVPNRNWWVQQYPLGTRRHRTETGA